jgi:Zn-dependent protease with chaperone function
MAGLLLCIVAIIIGFSYPEGRKPADFDAFLTLYGVVLCVVACGLLGFLASIRMRSGLRAGTNHSHAAVVFARLRKLSWFSLLGLYAVSIHLFDYPFLVRSSDWLGLHGVPLVEEIMILLPFFLFAFANLAGLYRGDRLLRGSSWTLWQYQAFYLRQFLVPVFPFLLFSAAFDTLPAFPQAEKSMFIYPSIQTAGFGLFILVLFSLAPLLFRLLWKVERLPDGPLRRKVEEMAVSNAVSYRDIYIWHTGGSNIANAMVTGILGRIRYIFVTDALLAQLPEDEVVAVLAHELGHAKHKHMQLFMVLAISFIAFINSADQQIVEFLGWLGRNFSISGEILVVIYAFGLLILFWGVIFGFTSRRLEQAADVFAAQNVGPATFGSALNRISFLSGGPRTMSSWRHFSIDKRVRFMEKVAAGGNINAFLRSLKAAYLVVGVILLLGAGAYGWQVYNDTTMPPETRYEREFLFYALMKNDYRHALAVADRALNYSPDWAQGHYLKAAALDELGRFGQSEAALARAIELEPVAYFYYAQAEMLIKLNRLTEARTAVLEALRLEPETEEYQEKLRMLNRMLKARKNRNGTLRRNGNPPTK